MRFVVPNESNQRLIFDFCKIICRGSTDALKMSFDKPIVLTILILPFSVSFLFHLSVL